MPRQLFIVYPPTAGAGFRHATDPNTNPPDRTLCGIDCAWWFTEIQPFDATTVSCKRCRKTLGLPSAM